MTDKWVDFWLGVAVGALSLIWLVCVAALIVSVVNNQEGELEQAPDLNIARVALPDELSAADSACPGTRPRPRQVLARRRVLYAERRDVHCASPATYCVRRGDVLGTREGSLMQVVVANDYGEFGEEFVKDLLWVMAPRGVFAFSSDIKEEGTAGVNARLEYARASCARLYVIYNATPSQVAGYHRTYGALFLRFYSSITHSEEWGVDLIHRHTISSYADSPVPLARYLLERGV